MITITSVNGNIGFVRKIQYDHRTRHSGEDTIFLNHKFDKDQYEQYFRKTYNNLNEDVYFDNFTEFLTDSFDINTEVQCSFGDTFVIPFIMGWVNIIYGTHFRSSFIDISEDSFKSVYRSIGSGVVMNKGAVYLNKYNNMINRQLTECLQIVGAREKYTVITALNSPSYIFGVLVSHNKHMKVYIFRNVGYLLRDDFRI